MAEKFIPRIYRCRKNTISGRFIKFQSFIVWISCKFKFFRQFLNWRQWDGKTRMVKLMHSSDITSHHTTLETKVKSLWWFTIHKKQCSLRSNRDSNWKRKCWVLESATLLKSSVRSKQTHFSIAKIFYNFTSCQLTTISPADKVRNLLGYFLAWLLGRPEKRNGNVCRVATHLFPTAKHQARQ